MHKSCIYACAIFATVSSLNALDSSWKVYQQSTCTYTQELLSAACGNFCETVSQHPIAYECAVSGVLFAAVLYSNSQQHKKKQDKIKTNDELYVAMETYTRNPEATQILISRWRQEDIGTKDKK